MRHGAMRFGFHKFDFPNSSGRIITMTTTTPFRFTLKKDDKAFTGTPIGGGLTNPRLAARNPVTGRMVVLQADGNIRYSDDEGLNWSAPIDIGWATVSQMQRAMMSWSKVNQCFFGAQGSFSRMGRSDDGISWIGINYITSNYLGPFETPIPGKLLTWSIPTSGNRGYSLDLGATWQAYPTPLPIGGACKPGMNPSTGRMVTASSDPAYPGGNAAYSDDAGETWTQFDIPGRGGLAYAVWWDEVLEMFFMAEQSGVNINRLWYAGPDGIAWNYVTFPQTTAVSYAAALDNGEIAVIGNTNWYVVESLDPFVYQSQVVNTIGYECLFSPTAEA